MTESTFAGWAILEQMGHRRTAGYVTSEQLFGVPMGRIDIPMPDNKTTTCYFSGSSVFALTPCTEELARGVATRNQPKPVSSYELPENLQRAAMRNLPLSFNDPEDDDEDDQDKDFND